MKAFNKVLMAAILFASCVCGSACASEAPSSVFLDYGTGLGENGNYNEELYAYNQLGTVHADLSTVYVPEDRVHKDGKTYGGFWLYGTGGSNETVMPERYPESVVSLESKCYYSDDLSTWKIAGSEEAGFCLIGREDDWEDWSIDDPWAAEVIYDEVEQKYFMFYNTTAKKREVGEIATDSTAAWDRLHVGIAVSDYPCGPFYTLSARDPLTGEKTPYINFKNYFHLSYDYPVIDLSPFVDSNGDKYLYFTKHSNYEGPAEAKKPYGNMGMKMKSWTEPDYETLQYVSIADAVSVTSKKGTELVNAPASDGEYSFGVKSNGPFNFGEDSVNEGAFMVERNGKYYLTFSVQGFKSQGYNVMQAVGDSPLGVFTKISTEEGPVSVISGGATHYIKGTGHHSFVQVGEELFIVYHVHANTVSFQSGWARMVYSDRVNWVKTKEGQEVMVANGPSACLQWLPETVSGYQNVAPKAKISVSSGSGAAYLSDGILPFYAFQSQEFFTTDKEVTVTLTFEKPVSVRSVMVYNADRIDEAFSEISEMRFELATKPDWMKKEYSYAVIRDLKVPDGYVNMTDETMINFAPAVAEFDEIEIRSLSFDIKKNARIYEFDKFGNANTALKLSEIVVLGRAQQ